MGDVGYSGVADWANTSLGSAPRLSGSNNRPSSGVGDGGVGVSPNYVRDTLAVLRKFGTDADVYLPGANGVAISGLNSGNYVESTFSTLASVDSVVGGARDPVGSIDATQATTANKPALRRGLYNLLTYSNDLSNAAWVAENTGSKSGNNILTPAVGDDVYHASTVSAGSYTLAAQLSGSGTCSLFAYNATNGIHGVTQITLTSTPTIFAANITSTAANTYYYIGRRTGDTATSITFGGAGLFAGTLTASQILSEGGIPLTTSTAASNAGAGRYSWGTDSGDSLAFGSVPFQSTDDFFVCAGAACNNKAAYPGTLELTGSTARIYQYFDAGGVVVTNFRDDAGTNTYIVGPTFADGAAVVVSSYKQSGQVCTGLNGAYGTPQVAPAGTYTLNAAKLANGLTGMLGPLVIIKGQVSAADRLIIERWVASLTPNGPVF